jgi:hypothetical protein
MKVKIITLTLLILTIVCFSQNTSDVQSFSEALNINIETYNLAVNKVDYKFNPKESESIFNHFVNSSIANTYFDNFKAKNLNGALINFNESFKKPLVLTTYATWYIIEKESILELNQLAKKHHKSVDFAVVFWENEKNTRKKAKLFNRHIDVLYIDERENIFSNEIRHMKYPLGQSLIYYIDTEHQIIDLRKNHYFSTETNNTYNKAFVENRNQFTKGLSILLMNDNNKKSNVVLE